MVVASSQAVYGEGKYHCPEHGEFYGEPRPAEQTRAGDWELKCPLCNADMQGVPIDESHVNPLLPYALSKYFEEVMALRLGNLYGIPTTALRYSLTYGPRQSVSNPYTGICSMFSTSLVNGNLPIIYEDGKQTRDFIFVEDVARANLIVAESDQANGQVYNVGTGKATTIMEFAQKVAAIYHSRVQPVLTNEFRPGDFRHLLTDNRALSALGWQPQVTLVEGLRRYAAWFIKMQNLEDYFTKAVEELRATRIIQPVKK